MLTTFRKNRKSIGVMIVTGLCAILMLSFGLDTFARQDTQKPVAVVFDKEISRDDYSRAVQMMYRQLRQQYGENFEQIKEFLKPEKTALETLVNRAAVEHFINDLQLTVGKDAVVEQVRTLPYFKDTGFTQTAFQTFLRQSGLTASLLEQQIKEQITQEQLASSLGALLTPSEFELRKLYERDSVKVSFRYAEIDSSGFESDARKARDEELQTYFSANQELYRKPRSVRYTVVVFSPVDSLQQVDVTEEDLQAAYAERRLEFVKPAEIKLREIVFNKSKVEEKTVSGNTNSDEARSRAEKVIEILKNGGDFEKIAREQSDNPKGKAMGGDLGWQTYNSLPKEIREAVARLSVVEFSRIVDMEDSYRIFFVEEKKESSRLPFSEVREGLLNDLKKADAPMYARAEADDFIQRFRKERQSANIDLGNFATTNKRPFFSTETLLTADQEAPQGVPGLTAKALQLEKGEPVVLTMGEQTFIVEVLEKRDSYIPEFSTVRAEVLENYVMNRSGELAKEYANGLLAKLRSATPVNDESRLVKFLGNDPRVNKIEETDLKTKLEAFGTPLTTQDIIARAFALQRPGEILDQLASEGNTFYIIELAKREAVEDETFEKNRPATVLAEEKKGTARIFRSLIEKLRADAGVKLNDLELVTL